jgi:hypothetical protein
MAGKKKIKEWEGDSKSEQRPKWQNSSRYPQPPVPLAFLHLQVPNIVIFFTFLFIIRVHLRDLIVQS